MCSQKLGTTYLYLVEGGIYQWWYTLYKTAERQAVIYSRFGKKIRGHDELIGALDIGNFEAHDSITGPGSFRLVSGDVIEFCSYFPNRNQTYFERNTAPCTLSCFDEFKKIQNSLSFSIEKNIQLLHVDVICMHENSVVNSLCV